MLLGSPEFALPGRWCSAAVPLVFSGRRQAFHSHDAAGALLHRHDPPRAAVRPDALDGGLWLSKKQHTLKLELVMYMEELL